VQCGADANARARALRCMRQYERVAYMRVAADNAGGLGVERTQPLSRLSSCGLSTLCARADLLSVPALAETALAIDTPFAMTNVEPVALPSWLRRTSGFVAVPAAPAPALDEHHRAETARERDRRVLALWVTQADSNHEADTHAKKRDGAPCRVCSCAVRASSAMRLRCSRLRSSQRSR
jgi:hypothetical protein